MPQPRIWPGSWVQDPAEIARENCKGRQQLTRFCGQNTLSALLDFERGSFTRDLSDCKFVYMPGKSTGEGTDLIYQQGSSFTMLLWKAAERFLGNASPHCGSRTSGACVLSLFQSCLTLCDRMDYRPPGSSVHRIHQVRIME